jgi:hypothetical protein
MMSQIFAVPKYCAKSKPFVDRVMTFSILDHRIWFGILLVILDLGLQLFFYLFFSLSSHQDPQLPNRPPSSR